MNNPEPPAVGAEVSIIERGEVRRGHVKLADTQWVVTSIVGFETGQRIFSAAEEGTAWARGWDEETQGALRAAWALREPGVAS